MREKYASLSLGALKEIAKARGLKGISTLKKSELVERMVQADEADKKNTEAIVEKPAEEKYEEKTEVRKQEEKRYQKRSKPIKNVCL